MFVLFNVVIGLLVMDIGVIVHMSFIILKIELPIHLTIAGQVILLAFFFVKNRSCKSFLVSHVSMSMFAFFRIQTFLLSHFVCHHLLMHAVQTQ